MDLLQTRSNNSANDLLEKRFIGEILREEAQNLDQYQRSLMSSRGFTSSQFYNDRGFAVLEDHKLQYTHSKVLRFIDMKSRTSKNDGKRRKKSHPVHNKPLFGAVNNVLRRLQWEYTSKMKLMLSKKYNIEL